jgi:hypothetical protein
MERNPSASSPWDYRRFHGNPSVLTSEGPSLTGNILIIAQDLLFVKGFFGNFLFFLSESYSSVGSGEGLRSGGSLFTSPLNNISISEILLKVKH